MKTPTKIGRYQTPTAEFRFKDYNDLNAFQDPPAIESDLVFVPALAGLGILEFIKTLKLIDIFDEYFAACAVFCDFRESFC